MTAGLIEKFRSGKFRKEPVFVNDPMRGETIYWPPDHSDVPTDVPKFRCSKINVGAYFKNVGLEMVYENVMSPSETLRKSNWMQVIGKK